MAPEKIREQSDSLEIQIKSIILDFSPELRNFSSNIQIGFTNKDHGYVLVKISLINSTANVINNEETKENKNDNFRDLSEQIATSKNVNKKVTCPEANNRAKGSTQVSFVSYFTILMQQTYLKGDLGCPFIGCTKTFKEAGNLKTHLRSHVSSEINFI